MNKKQLDRAVGRVRRIFNKPPRDAGRIEPMLNLLREVWTKHPDLRLGQLIDSARELGSTTATDIFYVEEPIIEAGLRKLLGGTKP